MKDYKENKKVKFYTIEVQKSQTKIKNHNIVKFRICPQIILTPLKCQHMDPLCSKALALVRILPAAIGKNHTHPLLFLGVMMTIMKVLK